MAPGVSARSSMLRDGGLRLLVATLSILAFAPALSGGFIFDDRKLILENPLVHSLSEWRQWFSTHFWDESTGLQRLSPRLAYYRPLVTASYAFDWRAGTGSPFTFHLTNLLLHAAVGVLVYRTLLRWVRAKVPALLFTLWFALHPTKAESVAWISGRTDVLCLLFMLLALEGAARRLAKRRGGLALEGFALLGAYLTKETAIVFPALLFIECWLAQEHTRSTRQKCLAALRRILPELALSLAYLGARALWLPIGGSAEAYKVSPLQHAGMVLETFARSIELVFVPHRLSIQQGLIWPGATGHINLTLSYVIFGGALLVAFASVVVFAYRREPRIALGLALFAVLYLPTSNVVPTRLPTLVSERFLYIPLLGLAFAGAVAFERYRKVWLGPLLAAWTLACGAMAAWRSHDFSDERAFWARELRINPLSPEAHRLAISFSTADGRYGEALAHFPRAVAAAQETYPGTRLVLELTLDAVELVSYLTPDFPPVHMEAIARFYEDAMIAADLLPARGAGKPKVASLRVPHLTLDQSLTNLDEPATRERTRRRLLIDYALLQSRLGRDDKATHFADLAARDCGACATIVVNAATVFARAGNYERALGLLEAAARALGLKHPLPAAERLKQAFRLHERSREARGPASLLAHAEELAVLGAYGRAYDLLAPHLAKIEAERDLALQFAELAWRAGHFDVSRGTLGRHTTEGEATSLTELWSEKMGWQ